MHFLARFAAQLPRQPGFSVALFSASRRAAVPLRHFSGLRRSVAAASSSNIVKSAFWAPKVLRSNAGSMSLFQSRAFSSEQIDGLVELGMPALSPTMEDGTIASWNKKEGDAVRVGDVIAEIETDKATIAFEAQEEGYIAKILVPAGTPNVRVGRIIALLVEEEEDIAKVADYKVEDEGAAEEEVVVEEPKVEVKVEKKVEQPKVEVQEKKVEKKQAPQVASAGTPMAGDRIRASPLAKITAATAGIDLSKLKGFGTGPKNRIIQADVIDYAAKPQEQAAAAPAADAAPAPSFTAGPMGRQTELYADIPLSNMRKTIAARLLESKNTIPHYYLTMDIEMDSLMRVRETLNKASDGEYKISVNDFIIKASALAMRSVPLVNASWSSNGRYIRQYNSVDVSVAMDIPAGLITPIVRDADRKGLSQISSEVKELHSRAVSNKLVPEDYQGGTFTISNLGMMGIDHFTAIINPPQSCILAVGRSQQVIRPSGETLENGQPGIRVANVMNVTLSCDHRVVDGANGARWLSALKKLMEDPMRFLL